MKMKERNTQLKNALGKIATPKVVKEIKAIHDYDTKNIQGYDAYKLDDELRLISMLNTLKLEPQYYRSEHNIMIELRELIEDLCLKDPYFVAQCIVYSRCIGEGMRSINHLAAALIAPFISGTDYAKRFYGPFDKKNKKGGCIYRPDDMSEIKDVYNTISSSTLTNAMKKGFAKVIENLDTYQLAKYRKTIIDISNLVHPNSNNSKAIIKIDDKDVKTLDAIMQGITVSADTWEVANSEAGQEVAKAVKEGKVDKEEAEIMLANAKNDNWESLLEEGKLGILAALRNIRNMLKDPREHVIELLCKLVSNSELLRKGKIMPYQLDIAYEIVKYEFNNITVLNALRKGYEHSVPNLTEALPGKTCVMLDCSGSMYAVCRNSTKNDIKYINSTCIDKASLIAATIAKSCDSDIVLFGSHAEFFTFNFENKSLNVFELSKILSSRDFGGTNIETAFDLITYYERKYDRIILLSDNEANHGCTKSAYINYIRNVCSPYIYCVDLAAYGTVPVKNEGKVNYYFGYGYALFDDIASKEFNPMMHIDKIKQVII